MTSSRFDVLAPSAVVPNARVRHPGLGSRLADRLDYLCQYPLARVIQAFSDGARVCYSRESPILSFDAWKDATDRRHWRLGRLELTLSTKRTSAARVTSALSDVGNRWGWGDAWDEIVALGIKEKVGAPARQLIQQGRWRDLDAWVIQRRAETARRPKIRSL